ncbi:MAG TPA: TIGR04086 family membrane protein [Lachnospiraceae bacterium]|nr:TIGR04086 family membrane protein [Lachnospiraceae bacterium]
MERKLQRDTRIVGMLKALLVAYAITAGLLLLLAVLLYKMELDEQKVTFGIISIYVISTFFGGIVIGKLVKHRRFLWGLAVGICYFLLLLLISFGVYRSMEMEGMGVVTTFFLCGGGGMLGGMVS